MSKQTYLRGYFQGYMNKEAEEPTDEQINEYEKMLNASRWPHYGGAALGYGVAGTGIGAGIGALADGKKGAGHGAWIGGTSGILFGLALAALARKGGYDAIAEERN
jgi:hypothetical protein